MKYGIISILLAISGILLLCLLNYELVQNIIITLQENTQNHGHYTSSKAVSTINPLYSFSSIGAVVLSTVFGIVAIRKKSFYGYIGLALVSIYSILYYSDFFLQLFLSNSALDINSYN